MAPEIPFLAAGAVAIAGGTAKAGHFPPPEAVRALFGTILLVILASATTNSKAAPVVHAIGLLMLLGAVMSATNAFTYAQPAYKARLARNLKNQAAAAKVPGKTTPQE